MVPTKLSKYYVGESPTVIDDKTKICIKKNCNEQKRNDTAIEKHTPAGVGFAYTWDGTMHAAV